MSLTSQASRSTAAVVDFTMVRAPKQRAHRPFTKAEIADIARGAKANVRQAKPKVDPIIAQINRADALVDRYIKTATNLYVARQRLDENDRGWVAVQPIDTPEIFREFGHGFLFSSEQHVTVAFRTRRKCARRVLSQNRALAAKAKKSGKQPNIELQQRIDHEKRRIAALLKFEPEQKRLVRKETSRLHNAQKSAGLLDARKQHQQSLESLHGITKKIADMRPVTSEGALAVVKYVGRCLFPDRADLFFEDRGADGRFWQLLQRAHQVLAPQDRKSNSLQVLKQ